MVVIRDITCIKFRKFPPCVFSFKELKCNFNSKKENTKRKKVRENMMIFKQELIDLIREYEKISHQHFLADESTPKTLWFVNHAGKKAKTTPESIRQYIEFKTGKKPIRNINDIFKIDKPKQVKKQWKAISCSMTMDELSVINRVMKENDIKTYNQFLRLLLLKFIEANKH